MTHFQSHYLERKEKEGELLQLQQQQQRPLGVDETDLEGGGGGEPITVELVVFLGICQSAGCQGME